MKFHAEFTPQPFKQKINHKDKLLLVGSCFTEQIGAKLSKSKFDVLENPHGIVFNPISIAAAISSYCTAYHYKENDLFFYNELWGSWHHHTKFSSIEKDIALQQMNQSQKKAIDFIKNADWILLTLGSAFVYEREEVSATDYANVVANCHKFPTEKFNHRLLEPGEIVIQLGRLMDEVLAINANAKFIFTISPVRHLREGFVENNRSKAALIQAVHSITAEKVFYFPAYELVIDDLRDYRFYAEDMVHPNYAATNYVWGKFVSTCIDDPSQKIMEEINVINAAYNHKAFNPASKAHKLFLKTNYERVKKLQAEYAYINFIEEAAYFGS